MIGPFTTDLVLADGYAAGLLATACALDRLARHVAERSDRHRTGGFTYHPQHDAWVCPADQMLWPAGRDRHHMLYRAKPSVCNACPRKADCTTSTNGREIVRALRPWPHSEAGLFHRGIALVLVVLAATLTLIEAVRHHAWPDLALTAATLAFTTASGWWLTGHLRATAAAFPGSELPSGPEPVSGPRPAAGRDTAGRDRYTTVWRSDS